MTRRQICLSSAFALFAAACLGIFVLSHPAAETDIYPAEQIRVGDAVRTYRLVVPRAGGGKPVPLVFAFHGVGDSPESMARYSQWDRLASEHRFILAYPGARGMWNVVQPSEEIADGNRDLQFFDLLRERLMSQYAIDPKRIYVLGMSHGATFTYLLAADRSQEIAAAVAHSGTPPTDMRRPVKAVPMILVVGNDDALATVSAMRSCADRYREAGHEAEFLAVEGLGHTWATNNNALMWRFLSAHPLEPAPQ